jgi:chromosome segregation ATPase
MSFEDNITQNVADIRRQLDELKKKSNYDPDLDQIKEDLNWLRTQIKRLDLAITGTQRATGVLNDEIDKLDKRL